MVRDSTAHSSQIAILRWLWHAWRGNRLQAILNALLGLVAVAVSLAMVWAMQQTIDVATHVRQGALPVWVGVMGVLILCDFGINISRVWIKNILGVKAQNLMQQQMLTMLMKQQWQGREARHSGDVINRLEQDVRTVVTFLTETLPGTLSVLTMFIGAFGYLFAIDGWLAVVTVGILPVFILLSRLYVNRMRELTRDVRDSDSRVQGVLTEAVQHLSLIKTMLAAPTVSHNLATEQATLRQRVRRRTVFSVFSNLMLNGGFALGYLVAFCWGAFRLFADTITFGQMTALLQLVYRIQGPARELTRLAPAFVGVFTAAERLMELEAIPQEPDSEPQPMEGPCGLRLDDVTYRYPNGHRDIVSHLTFDFQPGTATAVMGETGAGKTTLIRLLLALIRPSAGRVTLYGSRQATAATMTAGHRCNISYVPQGNTLFSGTIRDNLLLGNDMATDEQMAAALHSACADFVFQLPEGLDTVCAEQGGGLSEGQAQRLAIARALLRPAPIIILDEATSALDTDTERELLDRLLQHNDGTASGRTVICVTHRPAVLDYCHQTLHIPSDNNSVG